MEQLQIVCNLIILIGGACAAIITIFNWLGKPIKFVKKKTDEELTEKIKKVCKDIIPKELETHEAQFKNICFSNKSVCLQEAKKEIFKELQDELAQVALLSKQYEVLVISAKDVLREKIMSIYLKNKAEKQLTCHEREALDQYYKDYKNMDGNTYIDKYYRRMTRWHVEEDDGAEDDIMF